MTEVELHLQNRREMSWCTYRRIQDKLWEGSEKRWTSVVNSVDLFFQIHLQFSSTCIVILTNTCTVLWNMHVYVAKMQIPNHHRSNANIMEATNGCTILLCFSLKAMILFMATVTHVYSDNFPVSICNSQDH